MFKIHQIWTFFRNMDGMGLVAWFGLFVVVPASGFLQAFLFYMNGGHLLTLIIIIVMTIMMMSVFITFAWPGIKKRFKENWPNYFVVGNKCFNPRDWFLVYELKLADLNINEDVSQSALTHVRIVQWLVDKRHAGRYRLVLQTAYSNAPKKAHIKFSRRSDAIRFKVIWHKFPGI